MREETDRAAVEGRTDGKGKRRRSVDEIRADLDAIAMEYERIHGRPLLEGGRDRRVNEERRRRPA